MSYKSIIIIIITINYMYLVFVYIVKLAQTPYPGKQNGKNIDILYVLAKSKNLIQTQILIY